MRRRRLGVSLDHIATLRHARRTAFPDPVGAASIAESCGADQINVHLREDRRHIQERDVRLLRLFRYDALWGLSGTPILDTEQAQALYTLLEREKAHHPNLLAALIARAVRCDADASGSCAARTARHLRLVTLSAEERMHVAEAGATDVEAEVRMTSFVDAAAQSDAVRDLDEHFRAARARERAAIEARAVGHARAATILAQTLAEPPVLRAPRKRPLKPHPVHEHELRVAAVKRERLFVIRRRHPPPLVPL